MDEPAAELPIPETEEIPDLPSIHAQLETKEELELPSFGEAEAQPVQDEEVLQNEELKMEVEPDQLSLPVVEEENLPVNPELQLPEVEADPQPVESPVEIPESKEEPVLEEPEKIIPEESEIAEVEPSTGKRKLEENEKSRKKQKLAGDALHLSLSLNEVQSLIDLRGAAEKVGRQFHTLDALLFACKKAAEEQPDFNEQSGLRISLQLLPTHLTHAQLTQFRAQLLCFRLLVRNMQPPDRVLHTARGGYNKKEVEYAEFRRNLLPNIPETILEMNEYDKQSRIELANRRAKFWTDLQAAGY